MAVRTSAPNVSTVILNLNLLHLVLFLGALASVGLALREIRGRAMRRWQLFTLPLVATLMALILLLFQLAARQPPWMFGAAFALGLAAGAARGAILKLEVDQNWRLVRPPTRRALFWVALALAVAAGFEIGGALAGPPGALWRLAGAGIAMLCAGLLVGRAAAFAVRLGQAPHVDLRRR
ncbi:MAG: hypothetical protein HYZ40_02400 [Rhodospirillales bacterium]|nr:hypothetical protein [Rhodospirillales bacterium]